MSPDELVKTIIHPYKKYYSPLHQHFLETDIVYPAYSFVAKPFAWMMKDRMVRSKSEVIIADCLHYELKFSDESDGTKKMIAALPVILLALQEGRLVIIDELDAKLHPKLLRYVISLFKNINVNRKGAQLLFTSHDMTTMKNTVFRRDEIWFAAENKNHESEIYSLYEIRRENNERVNSTAAYDKQYLEGRYGADPYLTNMLAGGEWQ